MTSWTGDVVLRLHESGHTQKDLARAAGMREDYLSALLRGRRSCSDAARAGILSALDGLQGPQNARTVEHVDVAAIPEDGAQALARAVLAAVELYYRDPVNLGRFSEWLAAQAKESNNGH